MPAFELWEIGGSGAFKIISFTPCESKESVEKLKKKQQ